MASQADLDAIEAAIKGTERIVRFADGRSVEYRTVDEMIKAAGYIRARLSEVGGVTRTTYTSFGRD